MGWLRYYYKELMVAIAIGGLLAHMQGLVVLWPYVLLMVIEISLSGDNALVNVKFLSQMSRFWVIMFMTVGIAVAAGGMRFLFPIAIVALSSHQGFRATLDLVLHDHEAYAAQLEAANTQIMVFGAVYLIMIALTFFLVENTENHWIRPLERLMSIGRGFENLAPLLTMVIVLGLAFMVPTDYQVAVLLAGIISMLSFMALKGMTSVFGEPEVAPDGSIVKRTGFAAFAFFLALEGQDAAFSFDGVSGALAISKDPFVIAAALGVGALFVRAMTVHLMEGGHLAEFRYMENGAYWAILWLAVSMFVGIFHHLPEWLVGGGSVAFIVLAVIHSRIADKRDGTIDNSPEELVLGI